MAARRSRRTRCQICPAELSGGAGQVLIAGNAQGLLVGQLVAGADAERRSGSGAAPFTAVQRIGSIVWATDGTVLKRFNQQSNGALIGSNPLTQFTSIGRFAVTSRWLWAASGGTLRLAASADPETVTVLQIAGGAAVAHRR